jgi:hypothetical protein
MMICNGVTFVINIALLFTFVDDFQSTRAFHVDFMNVTSTEAWDTVSARRTALGMRQHTQVHTQTTTSRLAVAIGARRRALRIAHRHDEVEA